MVYNQPMPGMQNYQQYNPGMVQPFPYQDRMAQVQQLQNYNQNLQQQFPSIQNPTQQMASGLNGKVIQVVENIAANDVPMDGSIAFFPKQDMTEIYAKAWNADGTIRTVVYRPVEPISDGNVNNLPTESQNTQFEAFNSVLEGISNKIDIVSSRIDEFIGKPKTSSRAKKGEESNE